MATEEYVQEDEEEMELPDVPDSDEEVDIKGDLVAATKAKYVSDGGIVSTFKNAVRECHRCPTWNGSDNPNRGSRDPFR